MSSHFRERAALAAQPGARGYQRARELIGRFTALAPIKQYELLADLGRADPVAAATLYLAMLPQLDTLVAQWGYRNGNVLGQFALVTFCDQHDMDGAMRLMETIAVSAIVVTAQESEGEHGHAMP